MGCGCVGCFRKKKNGGAMNEWMSQILFLICFFIYLF
jgi:hypothetical protein